MEWKKNVTGNVVGAGLFGFLILNQIWECLPVMGHVAQFGVYTLLVIIAYGSMAAGAYLKNKYVVAAGAGVYAIQIIYDFIKFGVSTSWKYLNFTNVFFALMVFLTFAALVCLCLADFIPDYSDVIKKFWFVGPAIKAVSVGISLIRELMYTVSYIKYGVMIAFKSLFHILISNYFIQIILILALLVVSYLVAFPEKDFLENMGGIKRSVVPDEEKTCASAHTSSPFVQRPAGAAKSTPASKPVYASAPDKAAAPENSAADEIKKYKELLDTGAITQEEYDQKKKQLLNL